MARRMRARDLSTRAPDRLSWIAELSRMWDLRIEVVQRAYDQHPPERRLLLRYEDLLTDTEGQLRRLYRWLGLEADERFIRSGVGKAAFDAIEDRGPAALRHIWPQRSCGPAAAELPLRAAVGWVVWMTRRSAISTSSC
jgi:Sulfotransferase family